MGSTISFTGKESSTPNHSHVCGINCRIRRIALSLCESFPRMWDQRNRLATVCGLIRIIPTYVGSTLPPVPLVHLSANHSHVCGINLPALILDISLGESFPRMWDQQITANANSISDRIIPTYVGSTSHSPFTICSAANHSHVCGINGLLYSEMRRRFESFPRMWDQPSETGPRILKPRIIPTYVGSTYNYERPADPSANHSHVCGINPHQTRSSTA